nr:ABC transporter ATP-binding protein [uncultured Sellimonas sp.]
MERKTIKTLLKEVGQYKTVSGLTVLFTAFEVTLELIIPMLMAALIDEGIEKGDISSVYLYGGLMLFAAVLSLISGVSAGKFAADASAGVACNLRDHMYENIQTYAFPNIDKYSTAGLVTRLTTDVTNVQNAWQMLIRICVRAPISLIFALCMSVMISARISTVFAVAIVFLAFVLIFIMVKTMPLFTKVFEKYDNLNASVQENVTAIRVVKSFVREDYEKEKFKKAADTLYRMFVKAEGILALNNPSMYLAMYGCIIALSWFGAKMIVGGTLTTGQLTSLFSYVTNILMALMVLSMVFVMVTMSAASARRIAEVLNETPDIVQPEEPVTEIVDGSIDFEHVSFTYKKGGSGEMVLDDVDLHIHSGETIGILGSTGSSKSTLVSLISRLYDATEGTVRVGGRDVREYDLTALRNQVAVVLQKNQLFSGTILENLRWGKEDASLEECIQACRLAQADEFIQNLPDGYETYIEQGGTNVSGGQRQRLCIARALLKEPKVLILDDSTSAVDTATEAKIRKAFREKIPGTTKFIIAQRIASVQDADRIIVMDNGRIADFGSHEELMKASKVYREIYESQTKGGGDFDE